MPSLDADFFRHKYGGVEMWVWIALGVAVLIIVSAYRKPKPAPQAGKPPPGAANGGSPYVFLMPQQQQPAGRPRSNPPAAPAPDPPPDDDQQWGFQWVPYTVLGLEESRHQPADTSPAGIASAAYGLKKDDAVHQAHFATLITQNNPHLDWSRPLAAGTTVLVPRLNAVPEGAKPTQYNSSRAM